MSSLRRSALIAGAAQYFVYILAFVQVAVISRILSPEEVGTYLIASSLVVLAAVPRSLGVMEMIVAVEELSPALLRSSFTVLIVTALVMTGAYVFGSQAIASYFEAPELGQIIPIMAASFLFLAFGIIAQGKMRRDMQFGALAKVRIAGAVAQFVFSIVLVLAGFGVAGMAWGFFAAALATTGTVAYLAPHSILFRPGMNGLKDVIGFGGKTALGTFLMNLGDLGPQLLLGRVTNMGTVGYFGRGQTLITFLRQGSEAAMSPVVQPWFARVSRNENGNVAEGYVRVMGIVSAVTLPAFAFIYFQAPFLVPFLLGDAWHASIPIAQALALGGMFSPYAAYGISLQAALGLVGRRLGFVAAAQVLRFAMLGIAVTGGILPFAWALSASHVAIFLLLAMFLKRDIGLGLGDLIGSMRTGAVLAALVAAANLAAFEATDTTDLGFAVAVVLSGVLWLIGLRLMRHELLGQMIRLLQRR